jgi:transcription elongation factor Elf1
MEITACPLCGSKNIGIGTLGDGIISGLSSWKEVCRSCGYQGASLVFESEADYQKFLEALLRQKKHEETCTEEADEKTASTEPTEDHAHPPFLSDETHQTICASEKKNYRVEFLIAVVLSIVFFTVLFLSSNFGGATSIFPQGDGFTLLLFVLSTALAVLVFFFLFIVFVEMIYRNFRKKQK